MMKGKESYSLKERSWGGGSGWGRVQTFSCKINKVCDSKVKMVTIVDNCIIYCKVAKRAELKCSHM